ncbi:flippase-like domain-containing protein [candidate division WOR-3 bacterium]|nr:flippase-like domain-containing protein [candidate division WOR-3 bacterium]
MKRFGREFLKLLITIALFYYLFQQVPIEEVFKIVKSMEIKNFCFSIILFFIYYGFFSLRWKFLLRSQDIKLGFTFSYLYMLIAFFFNNFLPSGLGMDVIRSGYAGGRKDFEKAFGASLMERILGMVGMMCIGIFAIFSLRIEFIRLAILYLLLIVLIGGVYSLLVSLKLEWLKKKLLSIKFLNIGESIRVFYHAFKVYSKKWRVIVIGIGYSLLVQMMIICINFFLAMSLSIDISFISLIAYIPLITIISLIPITINGLGMRESAYVFLFSSYGIARGEALSLSLVFFAASVIASVIGGIVFIFIRRSAHKRKFDSSLNCRL